MKKPLLEKFLISSGAELFSAADERILVKVNKDSVGDVFDAVGGINGFRYDTASIRGELYIDVSLLFRIGHEPSMSQFEALLKVLDQNYRAEIKVHVFSSK